MTVETMIATDIKKYASERPPTTALHDTVGHASPSGMRMAELPNVHGTQPGHLTSAARCKPQTNPRRMGRAMAPGRPTPPTLSGLAAAGPGRRWFKRTRNHFHTQGRLTHAPWYPARGPQGIRHARSIVNMRRRPSGTKERGSNEASAYQGAWVK